jgi:hypothetical protein
MVEPDRLQMTTSAHVLCMLDAATDTHSECVILIAFSRQQWLRERASILRYTHTLPVNASESTRK